MEKQFSFEKAVSNEQHFGYKDRILEVINDVEKRVRVVNPDDLLHKELHERRELDSRNELKEFTLIREDICQTFGVSIDPDHVYILDSHRGRPQAVEQRALRCFYVLIDAMKKEGYYAEGRTIHHLLLDKIIGLMKEKDATITPEGVIDNMDGNPPQFIAFKGFLSTKEFKEISDSSRKVLETPLFDAKGQRIETATEWFISGHNLEDTFPPSPQKE